MSINVDWLRGSVQTILLQVVAPKPTYGYEICKHVTQRSEGALDLNEGSLYPALHKLERAGLLRSYHEPADDGRRRKYYVMTPKGRKHLERKRQEWREFSALMNGILGDTDVQPA